MDTTRTALWSRKLASALVIFLLFAFVLVPQAWADTATARPSTNGALAVEGGKLIDFNSNATEHLNDDDLTPVGTWVRSLLQGENPKDIAVPSARKSEHATNAADMWKCIPAGLDLKPEMSWRWFALGALSLVALSLLVGACMRHRKRKGRTYEDLLQLGDNPQTSKVNPKRALACQAAILASACICVLGATLRATANSNVDMSGVDLKDLGCQCKDIE